METLLEWLCYDNIPHEKGKNKKYSNIITSKWDFEIIKL